MVKYNNPTFSLMRHAASQHNRIWMRQPSFICFPLVPQSVSCVADGAKCVRDSLIQRFGSCFCANFGGV
jgi:hypothetical protein